MAAVPAQELPHQPNDSRHLIVVNCVGEYESPKAFGVRKMWVLNLASDEVGTMTQTPNDDSTVLIA